MLDAASAIPPYTMGWTRPIVPSALTLDVRFVNSPSGTPGTTEGQPITVTLYDVEQPYSDGQDTGAGSIQTAEVGGIQYEFHGFTLDETLASAAANITPTDDLTQLVLVSWYVFASLTVATDAQIRTPVQINMIDGSGADMFPPALISPEQPSNPWTPAIGRSLPVGAGVDIGGIVASGGGEVNVSVLTQFYLVVPE